jgi:hypothetical protein
MAGFNFITVRLGKDSIPDIKQICSSYVGILSEPLIINVKCTQVPDNYGHDDYAFLWLGSDNNKGMPTNWKQGFKAVGRVKNVLRGKNYNDTSETTIEIVYIFRESVNRMDILRCAPTAYYWCSSMPLIGLDDHANQTIRNMSGSAFSDLRAFFSAIDSVANYFKNDILQIEPGFEQYFDYPLPDPQLYPNIKSLEDINFELNVKRSTCALQQIFYGAPGTGKSNTIKCEVDQKDLPRVRTTFHPDSDYSTFVGAYKPTSVEVPEMTKIGTKAVPVENPDGTPRMEKKIVYEFVQQAFLKAYTGAWKNQDEPFFLIIEEINRGNCAQIFGDLFQLLDRNDETGLSDYPISPDEDIQKFLLTDKKFGFAALTEEQKATIPEEVLSGELMILPKNLHIWATMNTSDQSLFPIDSAFKRRWDWQYMPISNGKKGWLIEANGKRYDWWQFLQKINDKIGSTTNSEDKKLGYFFCKAKNGVIDADTFVGKVVFYIWNDVFKDFAEEAGDLFKDVDGILSFNKFYTIGIDGKAKVVEEKVERLLLNLGMEPFINGEDDEDENNGRVKYIIDGEIFKRKSYAGKEIMSRYLKEHPNLTFKEIKETFPDSMLVHSGHRGLIVSTDTPLDSYGRYYSPEQFTSSDGVTFKIYKQWTSVNINNIINFAKNQGLDIKVEESDGQGE